MICRLCGSKKTVHLEDIALEKNNYFHCNICDLIFLPAEEKPAPSRERKRYLRHDNTFACRGYVERFESFIEDFISPYLGEIEKTLDFGCGPGPVLASLLKEKGLNVNIYDPYFFPDEGYRSEYYDLITCTEVLEHLKQPLRELNHMISLLNPEGYLAAMTSLHPGPEKFSEWNYRLDDTHITFFSQKTIHWLIDNISLVQIKSNEKNQFLFRKK